MILEQSKCLIFIPDTLNLSEIGYLEGVHCKFNNKGEAYYIINNKVVKETTKTIGICNKPKPRAQTGIHYTKSTGIFTNNTRNFNYINVLYDYETFRQQHFEINDATPEPFIHLIKNVKTRNDYEESSIWALSYLLVCVQFAIKIFSTLHCVTQFSSTISHLYHNLHMFQWCLQQAPKCKQPLVNFVIAKVLDVLIGLVLLKLIVKHEQNVFHIVENVHRSTMIILQQLFTYLMGTPIGLKLNSAFNISLGTFFLYHILHWRTFLLGLYPIFISNFKYFMLPGMLGISFQVAMFTDLIAIASIHVYCIYIYASRLLNLQLRGLVSIWYLLIGRKYNPLRGRVDSCQYTHDQLLIGTLAFTTMLFLLPTTMVYYIVFAMFAFGLWLIESALIMLTSSLSILPVYGVLYWIFNPSTKSGKFNMQWHGFRNGILTLKLEMKPSALFDFLDSIRPSSNDIPIVIRRRIILYRVFVGYKDKVPNL